LADVLAYFQPAMPAKLALEAYYYAWARNQLFLAFGIAGLPPQRQTDINPYF